MFSIQSQIRRLKSDICVLEAREAELQAKFDQTVYPVLTLPNEITARIFIECLPRGRIRPSARGAPLVLAQICSQWRAIAISTGDLWCSLDMPIDSDVTQRLSSSRGILHGAAVPLLETWIARAKCGPLSMTIRSHVIRLHPAILALILKYANQFLRLELALMSTDLLNLAVAPTNFPRLQHLAVSCYNFRFSTASPLFVGKAPALRELGIFTEDHQALLLGGYASLNVLELEDLTVQALLDALKSCPQLAKFTACLRRQHPDDSWTTDRVIHPHLNTFVLETSRSGCRRPAAPILDLLTLPNLRRLDLFHDLQAETLISFVDRSSCVLKHLGLRIAEWNFLQDLLPNFASLTSFELDIDEPFDHGPYLQDPVNIAGHLVSSEALLPLLKTLTIMTWKWDLSYQQLCSELGYAKPSLQAFHLKHIGDPGDRRTPSLPDQLYLREFERITAGGVAIQITSREWRWPKDWPELPEDFPHRQWDLVENAA